MSHEIQRLKPRHHEIIRLAFSGLKHSQIAPQVGMTPAAVSCVLRSPVAKAELARLQMKAEESVTNVPLKTRLVSEINGFGAEALRHNRALLNDNRVDVKIRSRIAQHAMDRVLFAENTDEEKVSMRDILRRLDTVAEQMAQATRPVIDITPREVSA